MYNDKRVNLSDSYKIINIYDLRTETKILNTKADTMEKCNRQFKNYLETSIILFLYWTE